MRTGSSSAPPGCVLRYAFTSCSTSTLLLGRDASIPLVGFPFPPAGFPAASPSAARASPCEACGGIGDPTMDASVVRDAGLGPPSALEPPASPASPDFADASSVSTLLGCALPARTSGRLE